MAVPTLQVLVDALDADLERTTEGPGVSSRIFASIRFRLRLDRDLDRAVSPAMQAEAQEWRSSGRVTALLSSFTRRRKRLVMIRSGSPSPAPRHASSPRDIESSAYRTNADPVAEAPSRARPRRCSTGAATAAHPGVSPRPRTPGTVWHHDLRLQHPVDEPQDHRVFDPLAHSGQQTLVVDSVGFDRSTLTTVVDPAATTPSPPRWPSLLRGADGIRDAPVEGRLDSGIST